MRHGICRQARSFVFEQREMFFYIQNSRREIAICAERLGVLRRYTTTLKVIVTFTIVADNGRLASLEASGFGLVTGTRSIP
uniref:AlNc14C43G3557 protein n=1 Tax=Albugo laibachii Nc14 TaxID=890382 RepID=F0WA13_9STRA|nr:AlNc14C43G3557 [Albugo laibachii Nc14]|eukprot:CCA17983.1 AlNc14C43G3557 [Albugo laibachii Nc14]